jgi:hypothetical protein
MALQICPNCSKLDFTWSIDEEVSKNTLWYCDSCEYRSEENENIESICPNCNEQSCMALKDTSNEYWYCYKCQFKEIRPWEMV